MDSVRPLRAVLGELAGTGQAAGDVEQALIDAGYDDLPADLLTEAIVSFAAVAPPVLAEHLAPFVTADSPASLDDGTAGAGEEAAVSWGLDLIAQAPDTTLDANPDRVDDLLDTAGLDTAGLGAAPWAERGHGPDEQDDVGPPSGHDLDFGAGGDPGGDPGAGATSPEALDVRPDVDTGPMEAWSLGEQPQQDLPLDGAPDEVDGDVPTDVSEDEADTMAAETDQDLDPPW